jgi:hypothetical protein
MTPSPETIRQLSANLEQVTRERDAAIADMARLQGCVCQVCKEYYRPDPNVRKYACKIFGDDWSEIFDNECPLYCGHFKWRGLQGDDVIHEDLYREENARLKQELKLLRQYAPPVTPGMDIFSTVLDECTGLCTVIKTKVTNIWYNSNGWFFTEEDNKGPAFPARYIGQIIFLDEAAAQQKCMEINEIRRSTHG